MCPQVKRGKHCFANKGKSRIEKEWGSHSKENKESRKERMIVVRRIRQILYSGSERKKGGLGGEGSASEGNLRTRLER